MRWTYAIACVAVLVGAGEQKKARVLEVGDQVKVIVRGDESSLNRGVGLSGIATRRTITLLVISDEGGVYIRDDDAIMKAFKESIDAGDEAGVKELLANGRGFQVKDGTACLVLKRGFRVPAFNNRPLLEMPTKPAGAAKVRILDGPSKGLVGWIPVRNLTD